MSDHEQVVQHVEQGELLAGVGGEEPRNPAPRADPGAANPFATLRVRWSIPWLVGAGSVLAALAFGVTLALGIDPEDTSARLFISGAGLYGGLLVWVLVAFRRHGVAFGGLFRPLAKTIAGRRSAFGFRLLGLLAVTMSFSLSSGMVFLYLVSVLSPDLLRFLLEGGLQPPGEGAAGWLGFAAMTVVAAPLCEELFFRGVLVNRWGTKWGLGSAVIVSSLIFGVLHANPIGIGMVGVVVALLYIQTHNLLVPILFHAANNLIPTLAFLFMDDSAEPFDLAAEIQALQDGVGWGAGLLALSLPFLILYMRRAWPQRGATIPYSRQ